MVAVETYDTATVDEAVLRPVCAMWSAAFPTAAGRDRFGEADARRRLPATEQFSAEQVHCVFEDGACLAAARSFVRVVKVGGAATRVLALAHVATSPTARGRGLGAAVVREVRCSQSRKLVPKPSTAGLEAPRGCRPRVLPLLHGRPGLLRKARRPDVQTRRGHRARGRQTLPRRRHHALPRAEQRASGPGPQPPARPQRRWLVKTSAIEL